MMSRGEHYLEAERLLAAAGSATGVGYDRIAAAHVHALLATASGEVESAANRISRLAAGKAAAE